MEAPQLSLSSIQTKKKKKIKINPLAAFKNVKPERLKVSAQTWISNWSGRRHASPAVKPPSQDLCNGFGASQSEQADVLLTLRLAQFATHGSFSHTWTCRLWGFLDRFVCSLWSSLTCEDFSIKIASSLSPLARQERSQAPCTLRERRS